MNVSSRIFSAPSPPAGEQLAEPLRVSFTQLETAIANNEHDRLCELLASSGLNGMGNEAMLQKLLRLAVRTDNCSAARLLIAHCPRYEFINHVSEEGHTLVMDAASYGSARMIDTLAQMGASVNTCDVNNVSAVMRAVQEGKLTIVKALLENGASIRYESNWNIFSDVAKDEEGGSFFHNQVECRMVQKARDVAMLRLLLEYGLDINALDRDGNTALGVALKDGDFDRCRTLMDVGSNIHSVLRTSMRRKEYSVVRAMLDAGADMEMRDENGRTVFAAAAEFGHTDLVRMLIDAGVNINPIDDNGHTPLLRAARARKLCLIDMLVRSSADGGIKDKRGMTPFMHAVHYGHVDVIRAFVVAGADIAAHGGTYALIYAIERGGDINTVNALIMVGVNVHRRGLGNQRGNSALMLAAKRGRLDAVRALLAVGANVNDRNNDGYTSLMLAAEAGQLPTVKALLERGGNPNDKFLGMSALVLAILSNRPEIAVYLIGAGADVNVIHNDVTPLMYSLQKGGVAMGRLLEAGADVRRTDSYGNTPLMQAIISDRADLALPLINAGSMINSRNHAGDSPLLLAARLGSTDLVKALLERGADVAARNYAGQNALDLAQRPSVTDLLIEARKVAPAMALEVTARHRFSALGL